MLKTSPSDDGDCVCNVQQTCGGCPLLAVSRSTELEGKVDSVREALERAGFAVPIRLDADADDAARTGYRNRLRMKVVDGRADFFNQAKRDGCPVVRPDLWAAIERLRAVSAKNPSLLWGVDHLEVRVDGLATNDTSRNPAVGLRLSHDVNSERLCEALGSAWLVANPSGTENPHLSYDVSPGVTVDVPVASFVQVNDGVNRRLVAEVLRIAAATNARSFLDVFCGAGNFAVPLAAKGLVGVGVDHAGPAIEALQAVNPTHISGLAADAYDVMHELPAADLVVVDPPRSGVREGHRLLAARAQHSVVLVGCNVSSFAHDVASFCDAGLQLAGVTAFDMFPGTKHMETLAWLRQPASP